MRKFRDVPCLCILFAFSLLSAGCDDASESAAPDETATFRYAFDGVASSIDPLQAASTYANALVVNAYDTLYRYKYLARPYELTPSLAVGMPEISEDGLIYTIRLRKDVRFTDDPAFADGRGRTLTAHDFVFSMKRHFDPAQLSQGGWLWRNRIVGLDDWGEAAAQARSEGREPDYDAPVAGLRALDDHTLQIRLTRPYPQLLYTLATGFSAVMPPEALAHYGRDGLQRHAVGSGPFRLESLTAERVVFKADEQFRQDPVNLTREGFDEARHAHLGLEAIDGRSPPFVDRLIIDQIEEPSARWASFTTGDEIQYTTLPPEQTGSVMAEGVDLALREDLEALYRWRVSPEAGFVQTMFNLADESVGYQPSSKRNEANHALRCAIRKAFDWEARNEHFYFGLGRVFPGVIPPVIEGFDDGLPDESIRHDPAGARALLEEHGWTAESLPVIEYGAVSGVTNRQLFEQFRGWLEAIGYPREKIKLRSFGSFSDFNRAVANGQVTMFSAGWTLDYPDAQNTLQLYYGPNKAPGANRASMQNERFDRLYERAVIMQPSSRRNELFEEMNRIVIDECATISGLSRTRIEMWHRDVIMLPDREVLGGFFLRFVDLAEPSAKS